MVSFDVTSLYTTIPVDQALLIIRDLLEHDDKLADMTLVKFTNIQPRNNNIKKNKSKRSIEKKNQKYIYTNTDNQSNI